MKTAQLANRSVIVIDGPEAEHFLQNLITTDLDAMGKGEARAGALLTPQGKILFDFVISRRGETGFTLDCRSDIADDLVRRLTMYKLRAKVEISKQEQELVLVRWQDDSSSSSSDSAASKTDSSWLPDRRFPPDSSVWRSYVTEAASTAADADFDAFRLGHGVAESGADYALSDAYPHDILFDQNGGVGFRKGCYVGQEVVSRMHHRGTARRRIMLVNGADALPAPGTEIIASGRAIGTLGGTAGTQGIAIVRIDRVKDALDAGEAITAGEISLSLSIPAWASYTLPEGKSEPGEA